MPARTKKPAASPEPSNLLIHGDNLAALQKLLDDGLRGKIGLVYIDPPFATNTHFTIGEGRVSTISSSMKDPVAYSDKLVGPEFLEFLRARLVLLRELMAPSASIYLHIDYKVGHYVKVLMDEVFGIANFRNDITRIKCNPKNFKRKAYGNIKDMILFYTKGDAYTWHDAHMPMDESDRARLFKKVDAAGRRYTTVPLHAPGETTSGPTGKAWRGVLPPTGRHWRSHPDVLEQLDKDGLVEWSATGVPRKKIYEDERVGMKAQDIWDFKDPQYPTYPTQKNLELLKFIVNASSKPGDIVLDCFAGSGTALLAAQELGRKWIGIDASKHAIKVSATRLATTENTLFACEQAYTVVNLSKSVN